MGVLRLPGGCGDAFWRVWGSCLERIGWLSGGRGEYLEDEVSL